MAKAKKKPVKKAAAPKKKPVVKAKAAKKPVKAKVAAKPAAKAKVAAAPPKKAAKAVEPAKGKAKAVAAPKPEAKGKKPAEAVEVQVMEAEEAAPEEIVLTDAEGRRYCRVKDCDQLASVDAYCRYHYLLFWKRIQIRKKILGEGKLERYIEELTARYPDKFLDMLRKDLRSEKEFLAAIQELEIDESAAEGEFEEENEMIDEVRGMQEPTGAGDSEEF